MCFAITRIPTIPSLPFVQADIHSSRQGFKDGQLASSLTTGLQAGRFALPCTIEHPFFYFCLYFNNNNNNNNNHKKQPQQPQQQLPLLLRFLPLLLFRLLLRLLLLLLGCLWLVPDPCYARTASTLGAAVRGFGAPVPMPVTQERHEVPEVLVLVMLAIENWNNSYPNTFFPGPTYFPSMASFFGRVASTDRGTNGTTGVLDVELQNEGISCVLIGKGWKGHIWYGDVDPKLGMSCKFHRNMLVYELCVHKIAYYYYRIYMDLHTCYVLFLYGL